jgi:hypothetical protein
VLKRKASVAPAALFCAPGPGSDAARLSSARADRERTEKVATAHIARAPAITNEAVRAFNLGIKDFFL